MKTILTVVSEGNVENPRFALQICTELRGLAQVCTILNLILNNNIVIDINAIVAYNNHGRITHPLLNQWIIDNNLNNYPQGEPTKLIFSFNNTRNNHKYIFYPYQANLFVAEI